MHAWRAQVQIGVHSHRSPIRRWLLAGIVELAAPKVESKAMCMLCVLEHGVQLTRAEWRTTAGRTLAKMLKNRRAAFLLCFAEARHVAAKGRGTRAAAEWALVTAMQVVPLDLLVSITGLAGLHVP